MFAMEVVMHQRDELRVFWVVRRVQVDNMRYQRSNKHGLWITQPDIRHMAGIRKASRVLRHSSRCWETIQTDHWTLLLLYPSLSLTLFYCGSI